MILGVAPESCPPASETLNPSQRPTKQTAGDDSISLGVLALLRVVVFFKLEEIHAVKKILATLMLLGVAAFALMMVHIGKGTLAGMTSSNAGP